MFSLWDYLIKVHSTGEKKQTNCNHCSFIYTLICLLSQPSFQRLLFLAWYQRKSENVNISRRFFLESYFCWWPWPFWWSFLLEVSIIDRVNSSGRRIVNGVKQAPDTRSRLRFWWYACYSDEREKKECKWGSQHWILCVVNFSSEISCCGIFLFYR